MKNTIIGLIFLMSSATAMASASDCREALTDSFRNDSTHFQFDADEIYTRDYGRDHLARGIFTVRHLLKEIGCSKKDINFGDGPLGRSRSRCKEVVPSQHQSRVCYIESNLGYFFVSWDYLDTVNVTYNRWD